MTYLIRCPEHGDLWIAEGAQPGDVRDAARTAPAQDGVPAPASGQEIKCPWCTRTIVGGELEEVYRPD